MIITLRSKIFFIVSGLVLAAYGIVIPSAQAGANPAEVKVKIYEMRVSHSADCSNSVAIFSNPAGSLQDMVQNPTLGAGAIPNGSYQCIMVKISNLITFKPLADSGSCLASQETTRNVFRANDGEVSIDPNGNTIQGAGTSSSDLQETQFWAYFKVGGGTNNCKTPAAACTLSSPINVSGDRTGTLVVDFDGQIDGSQIGNCDLQPPVFAFR